MSSSDDGLDPEIEAAVRRAVRGELRGALRALSQIGGGLLLGFVALPAIAGVLVVLGAPVAGVVAASVLALLGLAAYAWRLPPFR